MNKYDRELRQKLMRVVNIYMYILSSDFCECSITCCYWQSCPEETLLTWCYCCRCHCCLRYDNDALRLLFCFLYCWEFKNKRSLWSRSSSSIDPTHLLLLRHAAAVLGIMEFGGNFVQIVNFFPRTEWMQHWATKKRKKLSLLLFFVLVMFNCFLHWLMVHLHPCTFFSPTKTDFLVYKKSWINWLIVNLGGCEIQV